MKQPFCKFRTLFTYTGSWNHGWNNSISWEEGISNSYSRLSVDSITSLSWRQGMFRSGIGMVG
jgi:hypothetical protein